MIASDLLLGPCIRSMIIVLLLPDWGRTAQKTEHTCWASRGAKLSSIAAEPAADAMPSVSKLSFTSTGTQKRPPGRPLPPAWRACDIRHQRCLHDAARAASENLCVAFRMDCAKVVAQCRPSDRSPPASLAGPPNQAGQVSDVNIKNGTPVLNGSPHKRLDPAFVAACLPHMQQKTILLVAGTQPA